MAVQTYPESRSLPGRLHGRYLVGLQLFDYLGDWMSKCKQEQNTKKKDRREKRRKKNTKHYIGRAGDIPTFSAAPLCSPLRVGLAALGAERRRVQRRQWRRVAGVPGVLARLGRRWRLRLGEQ